VDSALTSDAVTEANAPVEESRDQCPVFVATVSAVGRYCKVDFALAVAAVEEPLKLLL